ncbi:MauE/DoxX family redox-associated membrane protein [Nocardia sp. NPDC046763]|uniref:MauE/DoxX family redox-associated membrane protein n=1 Tax=Nocardia sp. NPDC046763 TaxID=3155256 RepID=UPI0033F332A3
MPPTIPIAPRRDIVAVANSRVRYSKRSSFTTGSSCCLSPVATNADASHRPDLRRIVGRVQFYGRSVMGDAVLAARMLLAVVFTVAGLSKLNDRLGVRQAVADFGVPDRLVGTVVAMVPLVEIGVGIGLVPATSAGWSAAAAIGLLVVFAAAITGALARGRRPDCRCFGQVHSAPVGPATVGRNLVLAALAGFVVWGAASGHDPGLLERASHVAPGQWLIGGIVVVLGVALAVQGWLLVNLARQQGRILLRLEALETAWHAADRHDPMAPGLPVGSVAPVFELPGLHGETLTLHALRADNRPVLLIFSDPGCGPCAELMPQVGDWQDRHRDSLTIVVISRGDAAANRTTAAAGVRRVLLQKDSEIADQYRIDGTPAAVLVDAQGRIASPTAAGAPAITAVVAGTTAVQPPADHSGPATTPPIGAPARDFTLPDAASERPVALRDFGGKRVLLLFWNPECGFCARMLADLRAWETTPPPGAPDLLVVSTGTTEQNRDMRLRAPVLCDRTNTVAPAYGINGTPIAVMIDAQGRIASHPAAGAEAVFELARELLASGKRTS